MKPAVATGLLRSWRQDELVRRLARNTSYLLSGNLVASLLGLTSIALTARTLGPELLGLLALIEAYARLVDRIVRPEPWQAIITYGTGLLRDQRITEFHSLLKFGALIDAGGALAATGIAVGGVALAGALFGWTAEVGELAAIYSLALLTHLAATPTAVLRLFDRYAIFAWVEVAQASLRLMLVTLAWWFAADLWTFVLIAMAAVVVRNLVLVVVAWRELARRGYAGFLQASTRGIGRCCPGIWGMVWSLKGAVLLRKSTGELDTLIVGGLLDAGAVGLYHVAKRLGDAGLRFGTALRQAVFPDVARLWHAGERARFRRTVDQINLIAGGLAMVALLVVGLHAATVIDLVVGSRYLDGAPLLVLQLLATGLVLGGTSLRPALLSMGKQWHLLVIVLIATIGFYATLLLGLPRMGVLGAGLAHVVLNGLWLAAAYGLFVHELRRVSAR